MSLYKSDFVCVKAWASAEGCIWEKENEDGKYTSCMYKCECYIRVHLYAYVIEGISIR